MQVPVPEQQHDVMIEAVENHMPEVIIVDEIGRKKKWTLHVPLLNVVCSS